MADDASARRFYVSWVDRRKDPWPKWAERAEGLPDGRSRKGRSIAHRAADDPEWPGVPEILDGSGPRPYLGPILTTLFHPRSPCNLKGVQHVYLLYEKDLAERSPHEKLHPVVEQIGTARGLADWHERVHLVPIAGITDHADHKQILDAVKDWIDGADPFNFRRKPGREKPHIVINLTSGTPTKHASWLMLYWEGVLGGSALNAFVQFVQGDESRREPLRDVPIDVLSQYVADVWSFWDFTLKRRCRECGVEHTEVTEECRRQLEGVFRHQPLTGNWRDLMRLADQVLLLLTAARGGRPTPLTWNRDHLEQAVFRTFHSS